MVGKVGMFVEHRIGMVGRFDGHMMDEVRKFEGRNLSLDLYNEVMGWGIGHVHVYTLC